MLSQQFLLNAELQVTCSKEIFPLIYSKLLYRGGTPKEKDVTDFTSSHEQLVTAMENGSTGPFSLEKEAISWYTQCFFLHKFPDSTKKVSTWFDLKHQNSPRRSQRDSPLAHALRWIAAEMHASLIDNGSFIKQCKIHKFRGIFKKSLLKNYSNTFQ